MIDREMWRIRAAPAAVVAFAFLAVLRIASTYAMTAQAYDEPAHIACGMEWLDKGTFTLEPVHPPLPRIAAAIGPYLAGLRLPAVKKISDEHGESYDFYSAGNEILSAGHRYSRNLTLSRMGMLPLFLIATGVVFVWAKDLFGEWTAVLAVLLFTTTPPVLALAGIAYVDFGLGAFLPATLFAFSRWLERATMRRSAVLGAMAGCALLSNYTALVFLPPCLVAILACRVWAAKRTNEPGIKAREIAAGVAVIALAALVVIWAGYRFSLQTLNKTFEKPSQDIAAMRGLPSVVKSVAEGVVALNPPLPAPQFLKGFMGNVQVGKAGYKSYLLGRMRNGGWWYFYFVVLALKTPLSLLILAGAGGFFVIRSAIPGHDWKALVPLAGALVVLLASIPIKVNLGIRHILFIYPLLAIIGAYGIQRLWTLRSKWPKTIPAIVIALVAWQVVASVRARPDYISYMNELAPKQRDQALVLGCDFDCGQDLWRLSDALRARQIGHVHLKVWTSTDLASWDLPAFDVLAPNQPATGWVAVSSLYLRMGELTAGPKLATAYAWLGDYKPVDHVGRTIQLYYIPEKNPPPAASPKQ